MLTQTRDFHLQTGHEPYDFQKKAFKVNLRVRSGIEYREQDKMLLVESEFLDGNSGAVL
jgi:hypothetical protein